MPSVSKFYHTVEATTVPAAANTYAVIRSVTIPLQTASMPRTVRGKIIDVHFTLNTIAGGCTQIIAKLCSDTNGDVAVTPEVTSTIITGVTVNTSGTALLSLGTTTGTLNYSAAGAATSDSVTVFYRSNLGTCNISSIKIHWEE